MAKQTEIIENLLAVKDENGYEMFKLLLQSMSDLDTGKFINELRYCVKLSDGNPADLKNANCAIFDVVARCSGKTTVGKLKEPLVLETIEDDKITDVVIPRGCFVEVSSEDNYPHETTDKDIEEAAKKLNEG